MHAECEQQGLQNHTRWNITIPGGYKKGGQDFTCQILVPSLAADRAVPAFRAATADAPLLPPSPSRAPVPAPGSKSGKGASLSERAAAASCDRALMAFNQ
jgi:hypothetical protein